MMIGYTVAYLTAMYMHIEDAAAIYLNQHNAKNCLLKIAY